MNTMPIYLDDSYMKETDATVVDIKDGVILDRTIFYPSSGGQPSDSGRIIGRNISNVFAVEKGDEIIHRVDKLPEKGERVRLIIDWEKRYAHMRLHTTIHIISAIAMKEFGARITGNQIGDSGARIDFNFKEWNSEISKLIERRVNEEISKNHEVTWWYMKRDEILSIEGSLKVDPKLIPELDVLRVVKIGDIDLQPDGGTHVKNTSELGPITIYKIENKGKNNKRMYFTIQGLSHE